MPGQYDLIIVGGGLGGSALAKCMAEHGARVLVLERDQQFQDRVRGIDYLRMRADGRIDLDIRAVVETENGCRIALSADGVAMPRVAEPIADLLENVCLSTAADENVWVNTRQVWGVGTVNFAVGKIHIDAYMQ